MLDLLEDENRVGGAFMDLHWLYVGKDGFDGVEQRENIRDDRTVGCFDEVFQFFVRDVDVFDASILDTESVARRFFFEND